MPGPLGCVSVNVSIKIQQTAHSPKIAFMFQEQSFHCAIGPVIHSVRQKFHRDLVDAEEVAHENNLKVKE